MEIILGRCFIVRQFKTADYLFMLKQSVLIEDYLPPSHLARFVVEEVSALDLSKICRGVSHLVKRNYKAYKLVQIETARLIISIDKI